MIRVLLADDHVLVREGLRALLAKEADIQVVAEAGDGREAIRVARETRPDVAAMDLSMPLLNGVEAARQMAAWDRPPGVILPDGRVQSQAVYLALGITIEGKKELMVLWVGENEGAKFWMNVLTELKNLGLQDILVACVDGLKGFPDAIAALYPKTDVQLCIVHSVPGRAHSKGVRGPSPSKTFELGRQRQVVVA